MSKLVTSLLLALLAATGQAAGTLPDDAVASVRGQVVTRDDLMREIVKRMARTESGQRILQRLLVTRALELEAKRRNDDVPAADLDAYMAGLEKSAGGPEALEATLKKEGRTRSDLRAYTRLSLLGQRMAATDLKVSGTPDPAQVQIWLDGLLKRLGVEQDPAKLAEGVVARIATSDVTIVELGEAIEQEASIGVISVRCLEPWIAVIAIEQALATAGVVATDEEVAADIARRKLEFESSQQARAMKIGFEQMIEAQQGRTLEDLARDREYRAVLGLRKLLGSRLTDLEMKSWFEKNRDAFGERRKVQQIVVGAGDDKRFGSGGRSFEEARRISKEIAEELRTGTPWETAATRSDAKDPGRVYVLTRGGNSPKEVLDAVFEAGPADTVGPVKTLYGYHILRVVEILPPLTFEQAKPVIGRGLLKQKERAFYAALRTDPAVVRAEKYR